VNRPASRAAVSDGRGPSRGLTVRQQSVMRPPACDGDAVLPQAVTAVEVPSVCVR